MNPALSPSPAEQPLRLERKRPVLRHAAEMKTRHRRKISIINLENHLQLVHFDHQLIRHWKQSNQSDKRRKWSA